jgi:hypothetical protein
LSDEGSSFVHVLLRDEDVYHWIRKIAERLKADIGKD